MPTNYKSSKRVVDSSDDNEAPPVKKTKISANAQKDSDGNTYWELSNARRVQISEYKGKRLVNIREYYQKDGQYLPGKKGISLTVEQFSALMTVLPQLVNHLSEQGDDVPLPDFGVASAAARSSLGGVSDEDRTTGRADRGKRSKGNHEPTSDEDE